MRATVVIIWELSHSEEHQCLIIFFYETSFVDILLLRSWLCLGKAGHYVQDCSQQSRTLGLSAMSFETECPVEPKLCVLASNSFIVSWQMNSFPIPTGPPCLREDPEKTTGLQSVQSGRWSLFLITNGGRGQYFMSLFQIKKAKIMSKLRVIARALREERNFSQCRK